MLPHQPAVTVRAGDAIPDSYFVSLVDGASVDNVTAAHGLTKSHVFSAVFNGFSAAVPPGNRGYAPSVFRRHAVPYSWFGGITSIHQQRRNSGCLNSLAGSPLG